MICRLYNEHHEMILEQEIDPPVINKLLVLEFNAWLPEGFQSVIAEMELYDGERSFVHSDNNHDLVPAGSPAEEGDMVTFSWSLDFARGQQVPHPTNAPPAVTILRTDDQGTVVEDGTLR